MFARIASSGQSCRIRLQRRMALSPVAHVRSAGQPLRAARLKQRRAAGPGCIIHSAGQPLQARKQTRAGAGRKVFISQLQTQRVKPHAHWSGLAFRLEAAVTDAKFHLPADPSTVRLTVKSPQGVAKVFSASELERANPGRFAIDFEAVTPGAYRILWEVEGSHIGHSEAWLHVKAVTG